MKPQTTADLGHFGGRTPNGNSEILVAGTPATPHNFTGSRSFEESQTSFLQNLLNTQTQMQTSQHVQSLLSAIQVDKDASSQCHVADDVLEESMRPTQQLSDFGLGAVEFDQPQQLHPTRHTPNVLNATHPSTATPPQPTALLSILSQSALRANRLVAVGTAVKDNDPPASNHNAQKENDKPISSRFFQRTTELTHAHVTQNPTRSSDSPTRPTATTSARRQRPTTTTLNAPSGPISTLSDATTNPLQRSATTAISYPSHAVTYQSKSKSASLPPAKPLHTIETSPHHQDHDMPELTGRDAIRPSSSRPSYSVPGLASTVYRRAPRASPSGQGRSRDRPTTPTTALRPSQRPSPSGGITSPYQDAPSRDQHTSPRGTVRIREPEPRPPSQDSFAQPTVSQERAQWLQTSEAEGLLMPVARLTGLVERDSDAERMEQMRERTTKQAGPSRARADRGKAKSTPKSPARDSDRGRSPRRHATSPSSPQHPKSPHRSPRTLPHHEQSRTPTRVRSPHTPRARSPKAAHVSPRLPHRLQHSPRRSLEKTQPPPMADNYHDDGDDEDDFDPADPSHRKPSKPKKRRAPSRDADDVDQRMAPAEEDNDALALEAESQLSSLSISSPPQPQLMELEDDADDERYGPDRVSHHAPASKGRTVNLPPRRTQVTVRPPPTQLLQPPLPQLLPAANILVPDTPSNSSGSSGAGLSLTEATTYPAIEAARRSNQIPFAQAASTSVGQVNASGGFDFNAPSPPRSLSESLSSPPSRVSAPLVSDRDSQSSTGFPPAAQPQGAHAHPPAPPSLPSTIEYVTPTPSDDHVIVPAGGVGPTTPLRHEDSISGEAEITPTQPSDAQNSQHPDVIKNRERFMGANSLENVVLQPLVVVPKRFPLKPASPRARVSPARRLEFGGPAAGIHVPTFGAAPPPFDMLPAGSAAGAVPPLLPRTLAGVSSARPSATTSSGRPAPGSHSTRPKQPGVGTAHGLARTFAEYQMFRPVMNSDDDIIVAPTPQVANVNRSTNQSSSPIRTSGDGGDSQESAEALFPRPPVVYGKSSPPRKGAIMKGKQKMVDLEVVDETREEVDAHKTPTKARGSEKKAGRSSKENASPVTTKSTKDKGKAKAVVVPLPPPPIPLARSKRTFQQLDDEADEDDGLIMLDTSIPTQVAQDRAKEILANQPSSSSPYVRRRSSPAKKSSVSPVRKPLMQLVHPDPGVVPQKKKRRVSADEDEPEDAEDAGEGEENVALAPPSPAKSNVSYRSTKPDTVVEVVLLTPRFVTTERGRGSSRGKKQRVKSTSEPLAQPEADDDGARDDEMDVDGSEEEAPLVKSAGPSTSKAKRSRTATRATSSKPATSSSKRKTPGPSTSKKSAEPRSKKRRTAPVHHVVHPNRVFAFWRDDKCFWSGTVVEAIQGGRVTNRYKVLFDDESEAIITTANMRRGELRVGDEVRHDELGVGVVRDVSRWTFDGRGTVQVAFRNPEGESGENVVQLTGADIKIHLPVVHKQWGDRMISSQSFDFSRPPPGGIELREADDGDDDDDDNSDGDDSDEDFVLQTRTPQSSPPQAALPRIQAEAPPRRRSEPVHIPVAGRRVFAGMGFVITLLNAEESRFNKDQLKASIEAHGGKVYDHWDKVYSFNNGDTAARSDSVKFRAKKDISKVFLITDRPTQTAKYLTAIALGVPCLSAKWIGDEINGLGIPWQSYALPGGHSFYVNQDISQHFDPSWDHDLNIVHDVFSSTVTPRPFLNLNVLAVLPDTKKGDRGTYSDMLYGMGAAYAELVTSLNNASKDITGYYDLIIVRDENIASVKKNAPAELLEKMRSATWFKQCLIHGAILPNFC